MAVEDAVGFLAYCEYENEQIEKEREKRSGAKRKTQTARLKKSKKR